MIWSRRTGKPIYHAIVWQSRQSVAISERLKQSGLEASIRHKTGLPIDAYFSGTKVAWLLENVPGAKEQAENGELLFGTIDTWLIWKLSGGKAHVTDYSNASRTMFFNIRTLEWDGELMNTLGIPRALLPEVRPSSCVYEYTTSEILGAPVPIASALGDQQSALFGQKCFKNGLAKNTYGTGCFLLMNTGDKIVESTNGLATTIAWGMDGKVEYALEGSVFVAGAAIQWLRDEMGLIGTSAESEDYARQVPDAGGVYFVPAFTGLGAPYWDENARGMMIGITRGTKREHMIRAVLESIAFQTKDVLDAIEADTGMRLEALNVDGGAASNDLLLQFQTDILEVPVNRPANLESTALGAAYAAGLAVGVWKDRNELLSNQEGVRAFTPQMPPETAKALYTGWLRAVTHARHWLD